MEMETRYPGIDIISFLKPISDEMSEREMIDLEYTRKLICTLTHIIGSIA
jgi:hypothetical protein